MTPPKTVISPTQAAKAWADHCAFAQTRGLPTCPCCGFPPISSREMDCCPACLYQPEHTLDVDRHRRLWIEGGTQWRSLNVTPPKGWDPVQTLGTLARKTALALVKGRPPRMKLN